MTWEPGKEYRTRGGQRARVYATNGHGLFPVHGAIYSFGWHAQKWQITGQWRDHGSHDMDLMPLEPEKRVTYLNVYPDINSGVTWATRAEADSCASSARVACVRVEFREGQFDD